MHCLIPFQNKLAKSQHFYYYWTNRSIPPSSAKNEAHSLNLSSKETLYLSSYRFNLQNPQFQEGFSIPQDCYLHFLEHLKSFNLPNSEMIQVNILKEKWRHLAVVSKQIQSLKINLALCAKEIIVLQN